MHAVASLVVACRPQDGVTKLEMSVRRLPRFRQQVRVCRYCNVNANAEFNVTRHEQVRYRGTLQY